MSANKPSSRSKSLRQRRTPLQRRAEQRTQQILDVAASLLERFGPENLNTSLIASELNISVGSVYHYFPNKHAILHSLGRKWLDEMTEVLEQIEAMDIESINLKAFVDDTIDRLLHVYSNQRALMALAQALWSIPDLRHLDAEHDDLIISKVSRILQRLGFKASDNELNRLCRAFLEVSHSLLIVIAEQRPIRRQRTLADLKSLALVLFQRHESEDSLSCADVEPP